MDAKGYYRLLLKFRDEGIRFRSFMGRRWFIVKGLLLVGSLVIVWSRDPVVQRPGLLVLGYVIGVMAADIRSYVRAKRFWPYEKEVLNWDKIQALSKEAT